MLKAHTMWNLKFGQAPLGDLYASYVRIQTDAGLGIERKWQMCTNRNSPLEAMSEFINHIH